MTKEDLIEQLKEYIDIWKSIFNVEKLTSKKNSNIFVCINFFCILIICKVSESSESQNLITTITILFFVVTFMFASVKSGVPSITTKIQRKITLGAFSVGLLNIMAVMVRNDFDRFGYGVLAIFPFCAIAFPIFSIIIVVLGNFFKKEKFTDIELLIWFAILSVATITLTQLTLNKGN